MLVHIATSARFFWVPNSALFSDSMVLGGGVGLPPDKPRDSYVDGQLMIARFRHKIKKKEEEGQEIVIMRLYECVS